jgi:beta-phosphoglucomutase
MPTISPQAFFFDFDGVIVDSEQVHMAAARAASETFGVTFTRDYYYEILLGFDDVGLFTHLWGEQLGKKPDEALLKDLMKKKNDAFMEKIRTELVFFDGVLDLINRLNAKSIPLSVVSGALRKEVELCLEAGQIKNLFPCIVSANDVECSKPHPESYLKAFQTISQTTPNLKPADCWAIEDSPAGIVSAKGAGLKVIGITNSVSADALSAADIIISKYEEIELSK